MESIIRKIALHVVKVHLFHGSSLVFCTVEEKAVVPDHPSRQLLGIVEDDTFEQAPVWQCRDIGKFRKKAQDIVACLFRIGMG